MKNIGIDEMYQSVGCKGIKKNDPRTRGLKKLGRGTYQKDKPPILTIVERNTGKTIFSVGKNLSHKINTR